MDYNKLFNKLSEVTKNFSVSKCTEGVEVTVNYEESSKDKVREVLESIDLVITDTDYNYDNSEVIYTCIDKTAIDSRELKKSELIKKLTKIVSSNFNVIKIHDDLTSVTFDRNNDINYLSVDYKVSPDNNKLNDCLVAIITEFSELNLSEFSYLGNLLKFAFRKLN